MGTRCALSAQFLALAEKQGATVPLTIGHRLVATSLLCTGDIVEGRAHSDHALALYNPAAHRPMATQFGQDVGVAILCYREGRARDRPSRDPHQLRKLRCSKLTLTGKASNAVQMITSGMTALGSTGSTFWLPLYLSYLATPTRNSANSMMHGAA
jgi:hypothetical protein